MKQLLTFFASLILTGLFSFAAQAEDRLTVVELFTSQGCSSCPPADRFVSQLAEQDGILALSWAVDYWDRLGWKDTFSITEAAERQAAYNREMGRGGVYTPQVIIDGHLQAVGSDRPGVNAGVAAARDQVADMFSPPELTLGEGGVNVSLPAMPLEDVSASVSVIWYRSRGLVDVDNGENRGRRLHYTNIVRSVDVIENWDGSAQDHLYTIEDALADGANCVAVLVQKSGATGPVIGAARLNFTDEPATSR